MRPERAQRPPLGGHLTRHSLYADLGLLAKAQFLEILLQFAVPVLEIRIDGGALDVARGSAWRFHASPMGVAASWI